MKTTPYTDLHISLGVDNNGDGMSVENNPDERAYGDEQDDV